MLVSGSTMTASSDQAWDYFGEFYRDRFLPAVRDKVVLFVGGDVEYPGQVDLDTGTFVTTMSIVLDESAPPLGVDEAIQQKSNAMRTLKTMQ